MKKNFKTISPYLLLFLYSVIFTIISYVFINTGDSQHDYGYHFGRLIGLGQSLKNGDLLPNLNFVFAQGTGYASPMFYGNWQFYLPAIFYIVTNYGTASYGVLICLIIFMTATFSYYSFYNISNNKKKSSLFAILVTLVFPWFGYGMTMAIMFVSVLFYAMYKVIFQDKRNPILLGIIIALLIQTHILSTVILALYSFIFVLLNIKKLTLPKFLSFLASIGIGLLLSAGYLLQYMEQTNSQSFFFKWTLRDFPFDSEALVSPTNLFNLILEYDKPIILILLLILLINFRKYSQFSRQLILISVFMFVFQSSILPWNSLLRYTFLANLQDTRRLVFFIPILILMVVVLEWSQESVHKLMIVQTLFYISSSLLNYLPNSENLNTMRWYNNLAIQSEENPTNNWFDTSGDEYFNLNFNHGSERDGSLSQFEEAVNVEITNVKSSYNNLEFDISKIDETQPASIVIPRIWYKGYIAEYSNGATGSQPAISYSELSSEEIKEYSTLNKPLESKKANYNGKIFLNLGSSGHVKVYYKKTFIQKMGYFIEFISWFTIFLLQYVTLRRKVSSNEKTIYRCSLLQ